MSPEPDADTAPLPPVRGTDSDVPPCWANSLDEDPPPARQDPNSDDTDEFVPLP